MFNNLGPLEWSVVATVGALLLASVASVFWGIVDSAMRPESQWRAAGQNKALWVVMMTAGAFLPPPIGIIVAVAYLVAIRPKLIRAGLAEPTSDPKHIV
jgi:hypothetical protein